MRYGIDLKDDKVVRAYDRKEYEKLVEKVYDFKPLKDGEKMMYVVPAFDFRGGKDANYGQQSAELIFAKRKGNKTVSVTFFTGWTVDGIRTITDGKDIGLMCLGLYTHYKFKKDAKASGDYFYEKENCPWTGKKCWGELGSSLYGDHILERLINEGSPGVWDEIDKELAR